MTNIYIGITLEENASSLTQGSLHGNKIEINGRLYFS